ncbi:hypothetical protein [Mycoplasmopsis columbina]|uniref:hypothetical protein n=1 Tax=Mycoplasmopsis columbina TaxID=114881 RepID=UPI0004A71AFE|nr:hypothetical protein [Mycoplasmopsis columbina]VEU76762.1 Uncharacterised protein [Mycoplasmopsis columbina]
MSKKIKFMFSFVSAMSFVSLLAVSCQKEKQTSLIDFDYSTSKYKETSRESKNPNVTAAIDLKIPNYFNKAIVSFEENLNYTPENYKEQKSLEIYKNKDLFLNYLKEKSELFQEEKKKELKDWFDDFIKWGNENIDFNKYDVLEFTYSRNLAPASVFVQLVLKQSKAYLFYDTKTWNEFVPEVIEISKWHYFIFVDKKYKLSLENIEMKNNTYITKEMFEQREKGIVQIKNDNFELKVQNDE